MLAVAQPWASASSCLFSQSLADSRCDAFMPPRGRPTLIVLPPVASSSVAPLSSASFCDAAVACRSLALAASPASSSIREYRAYVNILIAPRYPVALVRRSGGP